MDRVAKSVFIFGIYLIGEGFLLMFATPEIWEFLKLPEFDSSWRIICGFAVSVIGYYYVRNALANQKEFFSFTIHVRILQLGFFVLIYFMEIGNSTLVLFSSVEAVFGLWTWLETRRMAKSI